MLKRSYFILFFVLMFAGGCEIAGPDDPRTSEEANYQALWSRFQTGTYHFRLDRGCFCVEGGEHWVQVENGIVTAAHNIWRDQPVLPEHLEYIESIEVIFEMIERAKDGAHTLQVEYSDHGYPTLVSIDWIELAIDDEISYRISDVQVGKR